MESMCKKGLLLFSYNFCTVGSNTTVTSSEENVSMQ